LYLYSNLLQFSYCILIRINQSIIYLSLFTPIPSHTRASCFSVCLFVCLFVCLPSLTKRLAAWDQRSQQNSHFCLLLWRLRNTFLWEKLLLTIIFDVSRWILFQGWLVGGSFIAKEYKRTSATDSRAKKKWSCQDVRF